MRSNRCWDRPTYRNVSPSRGNRGAMPFCPNPDPSTLKLGWDGKRLTEATFLPFAFTTPAEQSQDNEYRGLKPLDILLKFLLKETHSDGTAIAFSDGGMLTYKGRAGIASSISRTEVRDSDGCRGSEWSITRTCCDINSAIHMFGHNLASIQCNASSVMMVTFCGDKIVGFVEAFSRTDGLFEEKERLLLGLIADVIERTIRIEGDGLSSTNLNFDAADLVRAIEQTVTKINNRSRNYSLQNALGMTQPTLHYLKSRSMQIFPDLINDAQILPNAPAPRAVRDTAVPGKKIGNPQPNFVSDVQTWLKPSYEKRSRLEIAPTLEVFESAVPVALKRFKTLRPGRHKRKYTLPAAIVGLMACLIFGYAMTYGMNRRRSFVTPSVSEITAPSVKSRLSIAPAFVSTHMSLTDDPVAHHLSPKTMPSVLVAAWGGDAASQFQLGLAFELGKGVDQSCARAAAWMAKAADQGYAPAEYNLALRYRDGDGVWVSRSEFMRWLRRASQHGSPQAEKLVKMSF